MNCSPRKEMAMGGPVKMAKGGCAVKGMKVGGPVRKMAKGGCVVRGFK